MLSREQAQALTRTVHLLRPAWNEEGISTPRAIVRLIDLPETARFLWPHIVEAVSA